MLVVQQGPQVVGLVKVVVKPAALMVHIDKQGAVMGLLGILLLQLQAEAKLLTQLVRVVAIQLVEMMQMVAQVQTAQS
jgi:hypothetical protein